MLTFFNKTLVVFVLCLIFVGQSTASMTMFYGMVGMSSVAQASTIQSAHHKISQVNHDSDPMMAMSDCSKKQMLDSTESTNEQCCAQECDCLTSGCSTVSAFLALITYPTSIVIANKIAASNELLISQLPSSLYRPPIMS